MLVSGKRRAVIASVVRTLASEDDLVKFIRRLNRDSLLELKALATVPECDCKPEWEPCRCEEIKALCDRVGFAPTTKQFRALSRLESHPAREHLLSDIKQGRHKLSADDGKPHRWRKCDCTVGRRLIPCPHVDREPEIELPLRAEIELHWRLEYRCQEPPAPPEPSKATNQAAQVVVMRKRAGLQNVGDQPRHALRHDDDAYRLLRPTPPEEEKVVCAVRHRSNGTDEIGRVMSINEARRRDPGPFRFGEMATAAQVHLMRVVHANHGESGQ